MPRVESPMHNDAITTYPLDYIFVYFNCYLLIFIRTHAKSFACAYLLSFKHQSARTWICFLSPTAIWFSQMWRLLHD